MERQSRISLDNPAFRGRLRQASLPAVPTAAPTTTRFMDVHMRDAPQPVAAARPNPQAQQIPKPLSRISASPPLQRITTHHGALKHEAKSKLHLPRQARSNVLKRQMVRSSAKKYRPKHRRPLMPTLLSGLAVLLFTIGLLVVFSSLRTDRSVRAQVKQLTKQTDDGSSDGAPAEDDPPINLGSYSVAPDMPKIFSIEKIGVNARVRRLGVDANNILKAPANIFDVGWYDGSAKPGENGTVVLDGHVSGPTRHGVFYSIGTLKAGDKVKLERGDGKKFSYTVTGTQVFDNDKVDMAKVMTSSVAGKPALNFMTCTGRFNVRTNSFEQRVVVFTVQD